MKLQLQLQYNSVQNDKKDSQSQKDSSALDESHNISIFIFHYHGYRHIATPLTCSTRIISYLWHPLRHLPLIHLQ